MVAMYKKVHDNYLYACLVNLGPQISQNGGLGTNYLLPVWYMMTCQGLARVVEWSANMLEEEAKKRLKTAELQAKKDRLKIWTNYVPPATNSKAIRDVNFTGKVLAWFQTFENIFWML